MAGKMKAVSTSETGGWIPEEQYQLPVSFSADGLRMVRLDEYLDPLIPTLSLSQLTPEQRASLVAKRIMMQPKFEVAMVGAGLVDQKRAIHEVKAQSDVGRVLIEIENRLISHLVELASAVDKGKGHGRGR